MKVITAFFVAPHYQAPFRTEGGLLDAFVRNDYDHPIKVTIERWEPEPEPDPFSEYEVAM